MIPADATATAPGRMVTADVSCTNPPIPATGIDFRNFLYVSGGDSLPGAGLERTREGYVEIIEMGTLTGAAAAAVTHTAAGVPANCAAVQGPTVVLLTVEAPQGGLSGTGTLINVNSGADAGYIADALAEFRTAAFYTDIANDAPNLSSADPVSIVVNTGTIDADRRACRCHGVPFRLGADLRCCCRCPRRGRCVHAHGHPERVRPRLHDGVADRLGHHPAHEALLRELHDRRAAVHHVLTASGACETVGLSFFNREERGAAAAGVDFSPAPLAGAPNSICWESTVLSFRNGAAHIPAATASTRPRLGQPDERLDHLDVPERLGVHDVLRSGRCVATAMGAIASSDRSALGGIAIPAGTASVQTFFGLPVTGFMVRTFRNGNLVCGTATCQGNYGSAFNHTYDTTITP